MVGPLIYCSINGAAAAKCVVPISIITKGLESHQVSWLLVIFVPIKYCSKEGTLNLLKAHILIK